MTNMDIFYQSGYWHPGTEQEIECKDVFSTVAVSTDTKSITCLCSIENHFNQLSITVKKYQGVINYPRFNTISFKMRHYVVKMGHIHCVFKMRQIQTVFSI